MNTAQKILKQVLDLKVEPRVEEDGTAFWFVGDGILLNSVGVTETAKLGGVYKITVQRWGKR